MDAYAWKVIIDAAGVVLLCYIAIRLGLDVGRLLWWVWTRIRKE